MECRPFFFFFFCLSLLLLLYTENKYLIRKYLCVHIEGCCNKLFFLFLLTSHGKNKDENRVAAPPWLLFVICVGFNGGERGEGGPW